jgi:hypothetical protein
LDLLLQLVNLGLLPAALVSTVVHMVVPLALMQHRRVDTATADLKIHSQRHSSSSALRLSRELAQQSMLTNCLPIKTRAQLGDKPWAAMSTKNILMHHSA